jgi:Polyketide cyclase / dehydrase and lipid transport
VSVTERFEGTVHEAETCWYDTHAWPSWIDGLDHVVDVHGPWPETGSSVVWQSGPAGRGRVTERVAIFEPLAGQTLTVSDDSIEGRQSVQFTPVDGSVEVTLTLEYEIRQRNLFTPLVDFLFIRRPMEMSLRATLAAFGAELAGRRAA